MKIYQNEKHILGLYVMPVLGVIIMIFFTALKIIAPDDWTSGGYLVAMSFMTLWTGIAFLFAYFLDIKPIKEHNLLKKLVVTNGVKTNGKIVDVRKKVVLHVNDKPSKYVYYAKVELENGNEITTDALLINPKLCEEVTVYVYEDKYYVTDFKISSDNIKSKKREPKKSATNGENIYVPIPIFQSIITTIFGVIFTTIIMFIEITADNAIRVIILPFFIAGMGVFLQGLLPLVFYKNQRAVANIGKKIYLFGFFVYWFGLLIVGDISAIRDKEIGLFLFSLPFWAVGIFALIVSFKKTRR